MLLDKSNAELLRFDDGSWKLTAALPTGRLTSTSDGLVTFDSSRDNGVVIAEYGDNESIVVATGDSFAEPGRYGLVYHLPAAA